MSAIPALDSGYWAKHSTIVITWPGDLPGVAAIGKWRRERDGSLSVEYTREALELALACTKEAMRRQVEAAREAIQAGQGPTVTDAPPQPARLVFGRMSARDGLKLARQAEQASQEALL